LLSEDDGLPAPAIVGKNVTFWVDYPDGQPRYFNGIVNRFAYCGRGDRLSIYRAEVVPWLWLLTKTTDCRIFQGKTVPDILKQIFSDLGQTHFKLDLQGNHPTWDYCVQYRETDFNFASRLMEEEGIFYFFQHEKGKHTLVLADHKDACKDARDKEVEFKTKLTEGAVSDHVWRWEHQYEFRTGKWAHTDYNFETPTTSLMSNTSSVVKLEGISKFEQYEFPGGYEVRGDGDSAAKIRMEEEEVGFDVVLGESHCRSFSPSAKFKMKEHHSAREKGKSYVITSVEHHAGNENSYWMEEAGAVQPYHNRFHCIPDSVTFRPERKSEKPLIQSVQTAVITGPPGEEIFTDKYGRVKVQFHWDREGKKDDKTSCWIRVSQVHAGKGWGGIDIPRIGEEVVVSFLEGDPDRPLITGRVYNAEQMPPFGLDGADNSTNKVISGMKSKTYKGSGYNEFIMDDTPGKELIRVHAQYDMDTTVEHDDRQTVHNNRTITVDGTHTETIKKDTKITITEGSFSHDVAANKATYHVQAALEENYDATQTTNVGKEIKITSKGSSVHITAATEIKLEVGASKLLMKSDGSIQISGKNIAITGSEEIKSHGGSITTEATTDHNMKGNILVTEGVASNTVKGGMVMLNP
jgi:type VI secretion system secreted protein VgrG